MKQIGLKTIATFMLVVLLLLAQVVLNSCSSSAADEPEVNFKLTLSSGEGGTVSADKTSCAEGEEVTVAATAAEGFTFIGWYEGEELVSNRNPYTFPMPAKDVALTARFDAVPPVKEGVPMESDAVDLGLSVKWSPWNVGASAPSEYGGLYGWGDPTGERQSKDPADYPSQEPPANISGTEYDIAYSQWGEEWRMPTAEEFQELTEKCTWEWIEENGIGGVKVTGPNGNHIFLPAGASRDGDKVSSQIGKRGCYWSGTLYERDNKFADYLYFYSGGARNDLTNRRYIGQSVRPVLNEGNSSQSHSEILVVYFSRAGENWQVGTVEKGNTAIIGDYIKDLTGADLFEIVPKVPYPSNYMETVALAQQEIDNNARPEIKDRLENLDSYTTVFIGSPIWHGVPPMIMRTFYEAYPKLAEKTLIPFGTHGGSGIGSCSRLMREYFPEARLLDGFGMSGSDVRNEGVSDQVAAWIDRIGVPRK